MIEPSKLTSLLPALLGFLLVSCLHHPAAAGMRMDVGEGRDMELFFMVQFWDVGTVGAKDNLGNPVDDRGDLFIRRGRFGVSGHFWPSIRYLFNFAYDGVGLDYYTGSIGTPQATSNQAFYMWDAFVTFALNETWADLTVGYFRPQVGRESITTAFAVNSLIKSLNNFYPRKHYVGRGPGRETGLNLGGLYSVDSWSLNYNLGLFDTTHEMITGEPGGGSHWSPLWSGRVAVSFGDAELPIYGLGYRVNYFGDRRGVTIAVNGTHQGQTNQTATSATDSAVEYTGGFQRNDLLGCDLLANYGPLNVSAEYDLLYREFSDDFVAMVYDLTSNKYTDRVWFVRAGYNIPLRNGQVLEPVVMVTRFEGDPHSAIFPGGEHEILGVGLNWYLDRNQLKINLHYHAQSGQPVSLYSEGLDEAGDFWGLGLQMVF